MNIAQTRKTCKAIWSLLVLMGATLQSSDNGANPDGIGSFERHSRNERKISIHSKDIEYIDSYIRGSVKSEIKELVLSNNNLETLPPVMEELENLKVLFLNVNRLKLLPDEIGKLVSLQELCLSCNELKLLPAKMVELKSLQKLDLWKNRFEKFPNVVGELKSLQELDLSGNKLESLPAVIGNLINLQDLDLHENSLKTLPTEIEKLKSLQKLNLQNNRFESLPAVIGNLTNLQELDLDHNKLKTLPDTIGELKDLRILSFIHNEFESLPTKVIELRNLRELNFDDNKLKLLPVEIGELKNLQKLYLSGNNLKTLPDTIGGLKDLRELSLSGNELESLPAVIGNLVNLQYLNLDHNKLKTLPDTIGELKNLRKLYLGGSKLEILPVAIGELENLQKLHLSGNKLETLPIEIEKLSGSLRLLNLRGNNISEVGDGERTVGWRELRAIFGDRVMLDNDSVEYEEDEISVEDVYRELKSKPMHWNFEMLKTLRPQSVPEFRCSEEELMGLWNENMFVREWDRLRPEVIETIEANRRVLLAVYGEDFSRLLRTDVDGETRNRNITEIVTKIAENKDSHTRERNISKLTGNDKNVFKDMWEKNSHMFIMGDNKRTMDEFIHHIYNPDQEYRRWGMKKKHTGLAKNLLGSILNALSRESDGDVVFSNINGICEGLGYCPDRQISEMMFVHNLLTGDMEEQEGSSLENRVRKAVERWVGQEKERVFDIAVTPMNEG
ncbi:uncharacterized protein VICG_02090, partial [Vittaforma corneae ATCC 50505]